MLLEKILEIIFEDGKKFQEFESISHLPDNPEIDDEFLKMADEIISEYFSSVDQNDWQDFTIYPAIVWQRLKRDTFSAGIQGKRIPDEAIDFFGYDSPKTYQEELQYLNQFLLNKRIVLQPIHLGTGEQGIMRRISLDKLAGQSGCWWNGRPSIGRWLVAMADKVASKD